MENYEVSVELKINCAVTVEANNEAEASQKVLEMPRSDLILQASDEEIEIVDVFELEETQ